MKEWISVKLVVLPYGISLNFWKCKGKQSMIWFIKFWDIRKCQIQKKKMSILIIILKVRDSELCKLHRNYNKILGLWKYSILLINYVYL